MFGVIVRQSLSLQRGAFTDLVFFLVLILSCRGQELIGPSQPIVALVGDDVILPCQLKPTMNVYTMTVEWARPDLDPRFVFVWRDGLELESKKHQTFRGRTSVFPDELKHGNVSMKLSKVKLSDGGGYKCFIPTLFKLVMVQLVVGCVSSPDVQVTQSSDGVMLECESKGWYPEPEMFWLDAEGNLLSALSETLRGPDGLYTVSSRLSVERRHGNKFTCRVTQRDINQSRENHTTVPDHFFVIPTIPRIPSTTPDPPGSQHVVISAVIGCAALVLIAVVIFAVWKRNQNRLKNRTDHEDRTERSEEKTPERDLTEFHVENEGEEEREPLIAEREGENNVDNKREEAVQSESEAEAQIRSSPESVNNMKITTTSGGEIKERESEEKGETNQKQDVVQGPGRNDGDEEKQTEKLSEDNSGLLQVLVTEEQREPTQNLLRGQDQQTEGEPHQRQESEEKPETKDEDEEQKVKPDQEDSGRSGTPDRETGQVQNLLRGQDRQKKPETERETKPKNKRAKREKKEETKKKGGSAWTRWMEEKKNQGGEIQPEAERRSEMERREEKEETEISQQEEKQVHRFREQPAESMEEVKEEGLGTERETLSERWQRTVREQETERIRIREEEAARQAAERRRILGRSKENTE